MTRQVSEPDVQIAPSRREQQDAYLKELLQTIQAAVPSQLALPELRSKAEAILREHTFPSTRQEAWRFTDLTPILSIPFRAKSTAPAIDVAAVLPEVQFEAAARLVIVNGHLDPTASTLNALPEGMVVSSLATLPASMATQVMTRLAQSGGGHEFFTALNTLGFQDAVVIWVAPGQVIERPIEVVYVTVPEAEPVVVSPRCLVVVETGSALTLVEDFSSSAAASDFPYLDNTVTEIWADEGAQVNHVRQQREPGGDTVHIGKTVVTQAGHSNYAGTALNLGARLARHHWEIYQSGAQTDTNLYGLTAIAGNQLSDTHSLIAMHHPHGVADQLHKCIVDDQAHAVFNGKVWVPHKAQLTRASQLNRNLLLSGKARVDTKPELDIVADNVKCAHGATVSQLDADEVFYLQSRGISAEAAQRLLIYGFAMDIIGRIPVPSLQTNLAETVTQWAR